MPGARIFWYFKKYPGSAIGFGFIPKGLNGFRYSVTRLVSFVVSGLRVFILKTALRIVMRASQPQAYAV